MSRLRHTGLVPVAARCPLPAATLRRLAISAVALLSLSDLSFAQLGLISPVPHDKAFHPMEFHFQAPGPHGTPTADYHQNWVGAATSAAPNPWTHRRLTAHFQHSGGDEFWVPGFFNGNGTGVEDNSFAAGSTTELAAGVGRIWTVRFAPPLSGTWEVDVYWEAGTNINMAAPFTAPPTCVTGSPDVACMLDLTFIVAPRDNTAPGFLKKGFLKADDSTDVPYLRFVRKTANGSIVGPYFMKTGLGSPENLFGYAGFTGLNIPNDNLVPGQAGDYPAEFATGFVHDYRVSYDIAGSTQDVLEDHFGDWGLGMPDWPANNAMEQGKSVIGALKYISDLGLNSIYFLPMNLGGDGRDTHPFADLVPVPVGGTPPRNEYPNERQFDDQVRIYDVKRMREWNTVLEFCMEHGLMANFILAEQELPNMLWLSDGIGAGQTLNRVGPLRKLFLKNLIAMFGHNVAIQWTLCEENGDPAAGYNEFNFDELETMAQWILAWDAYEHPVTVHPRPYTTTSQDRHGPLFFDDLVQSSPIERGQWLRLASLYSSVEGMGALAVEPGDRDLYGDSCEDVRDAGLGGASDWGYTSGPATVIPFVDEHGGWKYGAAPVHADLPPGTANLPAEPPIGTREATRRRIIYDVLLSGGGLGIYFGWNAGSGYYEELTGGNDLDCDHFGSRKSVFEDLVRARTIIENQTKFWECNPADGQLVGAYVDSDLGHPEVLQHDGGANNDEHVFIVYYPNATDGAQARNLGQLSPQNAAPQGDWAWKWIHPDTGMLAGSGIVPTATVSPAALLDPAIATGPANRDMVFVLYTLPAPEVF